MKVLVKATCIFAIVTAHVFGDSIVAVPKTASIFPELPSTTREPSLQAYGLPKRFLLNNGEIERIHLTGRFSVADDLEAVEKTSSSKFELRERVPLPNVQIRRTQSDFGVNGHIERQPITPSDRLVFKRSTENNEKEDLESAETMVFRPLFVYRQQMAERHRAQRSRDPIYGAYQYGPRRPVNHSHDNCRNKKGDKDNRLNALV